MRAAGCVPGGRARPDLPQPQRPGPRGGLPLSAPAVTIRLAREDDLPALAPLEREADARFAAAGHPELADGEGIPDEVARRAIAAGRITVAERDGAVVGWVYVGRVDGEACLGQISVATAHGRRGVGAALLRDVVERARAAGEASIVLNTQRDVAWNAPWFARHGFVELAPGEVTEGLRAVEAAQSRDGLDWSTRVHMRLALR